MRILPSGDREEYYEQAPDYPAGRDSLLRFVQRSIHYPDSAIILHQQGTVYVSFVVHTDGRLSDIHVKAKSIPLAREARRIAGLLPAFIPARAHGRPVEATYTMPVVFVLPHTTFRQ
ncbi:MAG: energy transducer TonB [Bacteroidetes bacterium]|nr:energy transducer TonB [Bacteroidota bacterium]